MLFLLYLLYWRWSGLDQYPKITWIIIVHQRITIAIIITPHWLHTCIHQLLESDAPWSEWSWISNPDPLITPEKNKIKVLKSQDGILITSRYVIRQCFELSLLSDDQFSDVKIKKWHTYAYTCHCSRYMAISIIWNIHRFKHHEMQWKSDSWHFNVALDWNVKMAWNYH